MRRYRPCFLSQKLGIAYAAVDGSFLDCNSTFASNLGFPSAKEVHRRRRRRRRALNPPLQVIGLTIFNISTAEDGQQMSQLLQALVLCDPSSAPAPSCVPVIQHCVRPDSSLTPLLSLEISLLPRAPLPPVFMICIRPHQLPSDTKSSHPLPVIPLHAPAASDAHQHLQSHQQQPAHAPAAAPPPSAFLVGGMAAPSHALSSGASQMAGDSGTHNTLHYNRFCVLNSATQAV